MFFEKSRDTADIENLFIVVSLLFHFYITCGYLVQFTPIMSTRTVKHINSIFKYKFYYFFTLIS